MHWHPNADECNITQGKARMTVFDTGPNAFDNGLQSTPATIGYCQAQLGHYVRMSGVPDLQFIRRVPRAALRKVSLSNC